MNLRERFIETNGIKLHVMEAGPADDPMILFLHGFPEFWYAWRKQIDYFAEQGYLVVAPDQRGYNLSDKPDGIASYTIDKLTGDIRGIIDFYGRDQIFLVGHDWGAIVAWWMAILYPERIKRLVIMNVPHPAAMEEVLFNNVNQMARSWYIFYFQLPGKVEEFTIAHDYRWLITMLAKTSRPGTFKPDELEKYRDAFRQPGAFSAMVNWYRALIQLPPAKPASFRITMPTLFLWGVNDIALLPELADKSIIYCDQGKLIEFEKATHWLEHEEADTINPLMDEFFGQK